MIISRVLVVLFASLSFSTDALELSSWSPIGPAGGSIFELEESKSTPGTLYAGTFFGGLYRTSDFGQAWEHIVAPFSESSVFSIEVLPTDPNTVYVSTFQSGIWRSDDAGATWTDITGGIEEASVNTIQLNPDNSSTLLAGTATAIYRSVDAGDTWIMVSLAGVGANQFVFDPNNPDLVYAATTNDGVFKSENGGQTWAWFSSGIADQKIVSIAVNEMTSALYAASTSSVYCLPSATSSVWTDLTLDLPGTLVRQIVVKPQNGEVYVVSDTGIYRGGETANVTTWSSWLNFSSQHLLFALNGELPYVAPAEAGLLLALDDGVDLIKVDQGIQNVFAGALASTVNGGASFLYAGTGSGPFFTNALFTPELGDIWIPGDLNKNIFDLEPHPFSPSIVWAGTGDDGVWASFDSGNKWLQASDGMVPNEIYSFSKAPVGSRTLYAGTSDGVFLSRDDAEVWERAASTEQILFSTAVAADPVKPGVAYFGTAGGVFGTFDDGVTVSKLSIDLPDDIAVTDLVIVPWRDIFAVTADGGLFIANDSNLFATWSLVKPGVPEPTLAIDFDPEKPWFLYMGTAGGGVYKSESNGIEWSPANSGLTDLFVLSILVDSSEPQTVYAGTSTGLYRSIDAGQNWQSFKGGLPLGKVTQLEQESDKLYASIEDQGVYESADNGETWAVVASETPFVGSVVFGVSSDNPSVIFASAGSLGPYRTIDNGSTWASSSNGMSVAVNSLAYNPSDSTRLYAASIRNGVFASVDGGSTWGVTGLQGDTILDVSVSQSQPSDVIVGTSQGVKASFDSGASWRILGVPNSFIFSLLDDIGSADQFYLGTPGNAGIFYTDDGANSWQNFREDLPDGSILALQRSPLSGALFASIEQGIVVKSDDDGVNWRKVFEADISGHQIVDIQVDIGVSLSLGASMGDGVIASFDDGESWVDFSQGLGSDVVTSIAVDTESIATYYASLQYQSGVGDGVYKYRPEANQWEPAANGLPNDVLVNKVHASPAGQGLLFAATQSGIFKSENGAVSWQEASVGLPVNAAVRLLVFDTENPDIIFAGMIGQGVYKSTDGGDSWFAANTGIESADIAALIVDDQSGAVFAGSYGDGLLVSRDGGQTWSVSGGVSLNNVFVLSTKIDPLNPDVIYAGTAGEGVLKSLDHGATWSTKNNGIDNRFVFSIEIDPVSPNVIYAGTNLGGVYVSENGGENWSQSNVGLFHKNITDLKTDAQDNTIIYAGTEGGGVFKAVRR